MFRESVYFFTSWITNKKSEILFLQGLSNKSHVHIKKMILKLYLCIFLWCNKHTLLFSVPFNVFLLVSCHRIFVSETEIYFLLWLSRFFCVFCDINLFLLHNFVSITETKFCERNLCFDRNLCMWDLFFFTETYFCDIILFLWQKKILWQILISVT